jgi:glycosyltransferase involved in cell wall biosynthesis
LDRSEFDLIIIDDGSSDDTREIVKSFEAPSPIRYAYQANAGLASAKTTDLPFQAPILLFLDDDDVSLHCSSSIENHAKYSDNHFAVLGYTALDPN